MKEYTPQPLPDVTGDPLEINPDLSATEWERTTEQREQAAAAQIEQADAIQYEAGNRVIIVCTGWRSPYQISYFTRHGSDLIATMHDDRDTAMQAAQEIPETFHPTAAHIL